MNSFERHGIKHLSPSALNCWRETPGLWCLRYLAQVRDESGPAAQRGNAVERGMEMILRGGTQEAAITFASQEFLNLTQGVINDATTAEAALIPGMVKQAAHWHMDMLGANSIEPLAASQLKIETWLDGVSIPVIGYIDFTFMGGPDIDCKSPKRCPSEPRPDHLRQIALYAKARQRPAALLYVTDKKFAFYCPPDDVLARAVDELATAGRSLERFLSLIPDADAALRCMPHPTEHYAYGDAAKARLDQLAGAF